MRHVELNRLGVRSERGRLEVVGDLDELLEQRLPSDAVIVGLGAAGLLTGAIWAAALGLDIAFIRSAVKDHGTGRVLDGRVRPGPLVAVAGPGDAALALQIPAQCSQLLTLADSHGLKPANAPPGFKAPDVPSIQLESAISVLTGSFRTQAGAVVEKYVETLEAACRYDVCCQVARQLDGTLNSVDEVSGILHGGSLLAATSALRTGRLPSVVDTKRSQPGSFAGPTCFLDDYIITGADMRRAREAVTPQHRGASAYVSAYGRVPIVDLGGDTARVLATHRPA